MIFPRKADLPEESAAICNMSQIFDTKELSLLD